MKNDNWKQWSGAVFRALPACALLLDVDEDFHILEATDAYLRITGKDRDIIGRPLFEAFPPNPGASEADGRKPLQASLLTVLHTRMPDSMGKQRYDTQQAPGGPFEQHYWKPVNTPVTDGEGGVVAIIHSVENITRQVEMGQAMRQRDHQMQKQIADAISTTQELERMEIGRELHDHINQLLVTARLYLGRAIDKTPADLTMAGAGLELLENAMAAIRSLSAALLEQSSGEENLMTALERLFSETVRYGDLNIRKDIAIPEEALIEGKVKSAVFRIIQEQYANVIRHAEAKNLYVHLSFEKGVLHLVIRDDGKGFEPAFHKNGMGFRNIKSRVAMLDGTISIQSAPGDGCTIRVHIPCSTAKKNQEGV